MRNSVVSCFDKQKMHRMALAVILSVIFQNSYAQLIPHERYEHEIKSSDNGFTIVPLDANGISLIRERNKFQDGKKLWELILLDDKLQENWATNLSVDSDFNLVGFEITPDFLFYLFTKGDSDSNEFIIIQLNYHDNSLREYQIEHEFKFRITHFSVVGQNPIFGGYISLEPAVLHFDLATETLKVIPGFFLKDTELLDLNVNQNQTFNALLIERSSIEQRHLVLKTFDANGSLLLEDYIEIDQNINILNGKTSGLKREELIILGSYTEGVSNEAIGFYSIFVDPFSDQSFQYFTFANLAHFLDYLPPKRASKIRQKAIERQEIGKSPDYKANLNLVRIEETKEGFYLLSEVYDPSNGGSPPVWNNRNSYYNYGSSPYSFDNPLSTRNQGAPYPSNSFSDNENFKVLETVLTLFNGNGKIVWNNSLKMEDVKRFTLEPSSDFTIRKELIFLGYKKENELIVNTSSLEYEPEIDTVKIPLRSSTESVRYESDQDTGLRYWYPNYFFAWGYQSIRDYETKAEDPVRYVFYINKFETE